MMKKFIGANKKVLFRSVIVAMAFLAITVPVSALPPLGTTMLSNVHIEDYFFTTHIAGATNYKHITDITTTTRILVLELSAAIKEKEIPMYSADFILRYVHDDGEEDRSQCLALGVDEDGDFGYAIGNNSSVTITRKVIDNEPLRFQLAFAIEGDVDSIDLYLVGTAEPVSLYIGGTRLYSVKIFTNMGTETLEKARSVVEDGGYRVVYTSEDLKAENAEGITIYYADKAESQAREISQRLMLEFGKAAKIKSLNEISNTACDILVWISH